MIHDAHRRLVDLVVANPGPSYAVAIGSLTVGVGALRTVCRYERAARLDVEKAREEQAHDETRPRFGQGAFLDGLSALPPTMEISTCESLGTYVGFAVPGQQEAERNFRQLMRTCRKLPAMVDRAPWLQSQIDSLRTRVDALSRTCFRVEQRGDGLEAIDRLWNEAVQLRNRLRQHHHHRLNVYLPERMDAGTAGPAGSEVHGEDEQGFVAEPPEPAGSQGVKRRHLAQAHGVQTQPGLQVPQARPFTLSRAQCRDIRAAIAHAWEDRDGLQRITESEKRLLGSAIAAVTRGSYPTHVSHAGSQDRRYTVLQVLLNATQYMTAWHRDAVRNVGETYLRKLALAEKT